jgi:hypothetical protein
MVSPINETDRSLLSERCLESSTTECRSGSDLGGHRSAFVLPFPGARDEQQRRRSTGATDVLVRQRSMEARGWVSRCWHTPRI